MQKLAQGKNCKWCNTVKPLSEFHRDKNRLDGRYPICARCANKASAEYYAANKDRTRPRRQANWLAYARNNKEHVRRTKLRIRYNITPEEVEELFKFQGSCCAICKCTTPGLKRTTWCIDHCHEINKVRGILCWLCNVMLANGRDSSQTLRTAAAYIEHPPFNSLLSTRSSAPTDTTLSKQPLSPSVPSPSEAIDHNSV